MTNSCDSSAPGVGVAEAEPSAEAEPRAEPDEAPPTAPSSTEAAPAEASPAGASGWGLQLAVLITGVFMSVLDISIVNVAIPVIRKDLGVSTESIQWISTAYSLTEGVVVPASAWLGARFGLKQVYVWSIGLFTAASAMCGLAGGLGSLVFFRILQATPGGILPVICITMLYRIVPREKMGAAMGIYGLGIVMAPGIGPTLGGYLVEHFSWRLIFFINLPVGLFGALAAIFLLRPFPREQDRPFDVFGFGCIAVAMFALLLALEQGSKWGWTSYPILILLAVATNLLALFVVIELQVKHPLLDVRVFKHWPFVNSLLLISSMSVGLFAVLFYVPVFLQGVQGLSAWDTGLVLLPQALIMMVLMPVGGQIYDRFGARWPATIGLALTGTGILLLSRINVDISRSELIVGMVVMAGGLALGMMPVMTSGLSALPMEVTDTGSALNTLTQRVTSALGLAVLTAMVTADRAQFWADRSALLTGTGADVHPQVQQMQQHGPAGLLPLWQQLTSQVQTQAYSNAFFVSGCVTLAGVVLAFRLRSGQPSTATDAPVVH